MAHPTVPPPIPVHVLPIEPIPRPARRGDSLVGAAARCTFIYLVCYVAVLFAAAMVMCRDTTSAAKGSPGVWVGFVWLVHLLEALMFLIFAAIQPPNLFAITAGAGLVVFSAWRCKAAGRPAPGWVMGVTFGLLAGALMINTVHLGAGPAIPPLKYPIPPWGGAAAVPIIGAVLSYLADLPRAGALAHERQAH